MLSQDDFPALSAHNQTTRQEQHVTRTTATAQRTNILTPDQADHLVSGITGHRLGNAAVGEGLVQVAVPPGETVAVSGSIEGQPIARTVFSSQTALPAREMAIVGQTEEIVPATVVKKTTILAETQRIPTQTLVREEIDRTSTLTETTKGISMEAVGIASKTAGMAVGATEAAAATVYNKTAEAGAFVRDTATSAAETAKEKAFEAKETLKEGAEVVAEKTHDLTLGTAEMIGTGVGHVANATEAAAKKAANVAETVAEGTAEIVGGGAGLIVNTATGTAELAKDATLGAVHLVEEGAGIAVNAASSAVETVYDTGAAVANKAKEEFEAAEEVAHNIVIGAAEKVGAGAGHVANVAEAVTDTTYNVVTGTAELAKDVTLGAAHLTKDFTMGTVHLAENAVTGTAHLAKDITVGTATLAKDITVGTVQKTAQVAGAGAGFLVNTATSIASTAAHVVTGTVSTVVGAASTAVEMAGDGASAVVQGVVGLGEVAKDKIIAPAAEVIEKEEKIAEDYSVYESVMEKEGKEVHRTEMRQKDIGVDLASPEGVVLTQGVRWSNLAVAEPPVTTVERVPAEIITERTTFIPPTGEIVTEKVGQITTGFTGLGPATVISSHTIPLATESIEPVVEPQITQENFTGLAGQPQKLTNLTSQVTAGTLPPGVVIRDSFGQGQTVEHLCSEQEIVTGKNPVHGLPKTFSGALKEGLEEMPPVASLEEKSFASAVKEPIPQARHIQLERKPLEADFLRGREEVMTDLQTARGGEDIYGYAPAHEAEHYAIEEKDRIHQSLPKAFEGEGHMPGYCPKGPSMAAPREKTWMAAIKRDSSPKSGTGYITDESESAAEADSKWLDEGGASTELSDRLHGSEIKEVRARHDSLMSDASWTTDADFRDRTGSTKSALSFGSPIKEHMKTLDSDDEGMNEEHEITSLDDDLVMNIFPKSGKKAVLPIDNTIGKEPIPFEPVGPGGKIGAAPLPDLVDQRI